VSAVVVNVIAFLLLIILAVSQPPQRDEAVVRIIEPEPIEELEEPEPIIEELETPDIIEDIPIPDVEMPESADPSPPVDFSPQPAEFDSVAIVKSPIIMRGIYGSRSPGSRGSLLGRYGGSSATECAVMRALRWLKKEQYSDGSWGHGSPPPAMTGLALLTFLAHGETPASQEFGVTVEKAIKWLVDNERADGRFNQADNHDYSHPIAAYAISEAYGMTKIPMLKDAAEKSIRTIVNGQHANGGWNYNCDGQARDDTSYMAWCAQALKAAYMADLDVDGLDASMRKAIDGFKMNSVGGGGFGYTGPDSATGLSGAGALAMQLMGASKSDEVRSAVAWIGNNITCNWGQPYGERPIYYWYYITQANFHTGGETWNSWNKQFSMELVKSQNIIKDGIMGIDGKMKDIGYWDAPGSRAPEQTYGPVYNTTLCTLMLEVYYRYLPTFKSPDVIVEDNDIVADDDIDVDIGI
jgi:hypothetical protein